MEDWKLGQASLSKEAGGGPSIEARRSKQVDGRFHRRLEDLGAMGEIAVHPSGKKEERAGAGEGFESGLRPASGP
ncbi:hypothetical protein CDL15_Pgr016212 [Punica granatum]|uniref:Uncharacterized protein n=1 Tax=Punica granatum TaxID=22663 RepID=A0A218X107_PUNGR|nr:hypothetical protein CDL15_Pgr016212 [Punica granatum]